MKKNDLDDLIPHLDNLSVSQLEDLLYSLSDYKDQPVSINEFIDSPKFLGPYFENGCNPHWRKVLNEIYPSPYGSAHFIVSLRGCLAADTRVTLLDDRELSIKEIVDTFSKDKDFWVMSFNTSTKSFEPDRVTDAFLSGYQTVYEIELDSGEKIKCTSDHKFLSRNNKWISIDSGLIPGISLYPYSSRKYGGYTWMYLQAEKRWVPRYKVVAQWKTDIPDGYHVHHKNSSKSYDVPSNLCVLTPEQHFKYHAKLGGVRLKEWRAAIGEDAWREELKVRTDRALDLLWNSDLPVYQEARELHRESIRNHMLTSGQAQSMAKSAYEKCPGLRDRQRDRLTAYNKSIQGRDTSRNNASHMRDLLKTKSESEIKLVRLKQGLGTLRRHKGESSPEVLERLAQIRELCPNYNHSVVAIRKIGQEPVYDLTIERNHNFVLSSGIIAHNCIGAGKTTTACIGIAYDLHRLLCMASPQKSFGLVQSTTILFAIFNITMSLTTDVVWDKLSQMFVTSPYFSKYLGILGTKKKKNETLFPNRIDFFLGSRVGHSLGKAVHCLKGDTLIPLLDGTEDTIENLVTRVLNKEEIFVYSYDTNRKDLVPGRVINAASSGTKRVYRVHLDNGKYVDASDNHPFLMRNNKYVQVRDLRVGDSILPFNLIKSESGYLEYQHPNTGIFEPVAYAISRWKNGSRDGKSVHHKFDKKRDNRPGNLSLLRAHDHIRFHARTKAQWWARLSKEEYEDFCKRIGGWISDWWRSLTKDEYEVYCAKLGRPCSDERKEIISKHWINYWANLSIVEYQSICKSRGESLSKTISENKDYFFKHHMDNLAKANYWVYGEGNSNHIKEAARKFREDPSYEDSRLQHKTSMRDYYDSDRSNDRCERQKVVMSSAIGSYWSNITPEGREDHNRRNYRSKILKEAFRKFNTGPIDYSNFKYSENTINKYFGDRNSLDITLSNYNHKISSIEYIGDFEVFDITVDKYHNFATSAGALCHNSAILDEANFEIVGGQVYDTFNSLLRRMESRFMGVGGGLPGKIWVVSSETDKFSVVNSIVDSYKGKSGIYVSQAALWEVITHKNGLPIYSGETFWVFTGSDVKQPEVLPDDSITIQNEPELCIKVPVEFRDSFESDVQAALRDIAGKSTTSSYKLFRLKDRLVNSMSITPLFPEIIELDFDDDNEQLANFLIFKQYFNNPIHKTIPRHIHIDIGLTGDRLGIAASYVSGYRERKSRDIATFQEIIETVPELVTEWCTAVIPRPGKQVPLYKIRVFIKWLTTQGYPIDKISCDGFASEDMLQMLEKMGYASELLSVDRTNTPYLVARAAIYEGRAMLPKNYLLLTEMQDLELSSDGNKVDHPDRSSTGGKGGKDCSDAVCGSLYHAEMNSHRMKLLHYAANVSTNNTLGTEIIETFWGNNN